MLASSKQKCSKTSAFPKSYYSCQNTSNYFALTVQQTQRTAFGNIYNPVRYGLTVYIHTFTLVLLLNAV